MHDLLDEGLKAVNVKRLGKVRVHAAFQGALAVLGKRVGAHGDDGQRCAQRVARVAA